MFLLGHNLRFSQHGKYWLQFWLAAGKTYQNYNVLTSFRTRLPHLLWFWNSPLFHALQVLFSWQKVGYICMSNSLKSVKKTYSGKSDSTVYYFRISSFKRVKYEFMWNLKTHARKTNKQFVLPDDKIKFLQMYGDSHLFPKL